MKQLRLGIFGGAKKGPFAIFEQSKRWLETLIGTIGTGNIKSLITGAGPGMMEMANKLAQKHGIHSVGVSIKAIAAFEPLNDYMDRQVIEPDMCCRKMFTLRGTDLLIILPGGDGTMDEFFEAKTLMKLGLLPLVPILVFNIDGYYHGLETQLNTSVKYGYSGNDNLHGVDVQFINSIEEVEKLKETHALLQKKG